MFPDVLRRLAPKDAVSGLTPVPDSFVPIIKMVLNNIEIDLIFCAIESKATIPRGMKLDDNKLLDGLDQASIRAISGPRVTDEILALVPEQKTFRTALRAIKLWAQRRAIYANIVGYPGGVAWAMLVARVCQLYPHAVGATLVDKFFFIIKDWNWPDPILLKDIESGGREKVWNPKIYPGDKKNIMPIITPAYPSMCATYNISKSGKTIILKEIRRGHQITQQIFAGKLAWRDLFKKHTFFTEDHKYYLGIIVTAKNQDAAKAFSGLVESKVRILVMQLELQTDLIDLARPFTKGTKRTHKVSNAEQVKEVERGSMKYRVGQTETVETTDPELVTANGEGAAVPDAMEVAPKVEENEPQTLHTVTFYIGIDLTQNASKNVDMTAAISYFKSMCTGWSNYRDDMHTLEVMPVKSYDLPDDLFDTTKGETKPTKPLKIKKKAPPTAVKRSFSEVEEPDTNGPAKRHANFAASQTPTAA
jgi:poly(A) polymerase